MKNIQIKSSIGNLAFREIPEDMIKDMLTSRLSRELADNFFKDLKLKRENSDIVCAVDYFYNFYICEASEYNAIMHKLHELIKYVQTKRSDDQLLYLLVDLKNEMLKDS